MLKISFEQLDRLEKHYPGIKDQIMRLEGKELPACPRCASRRTLLVGVGVVGRSIQMAISTTRFRLVASGPRPGKFACASCQHYFDDEGITIDNSW